MKKIKKYIKEISNNLMLDFDEEEINNIQKDLINYKKELNAIKKMDLSNVIETDFIKSLVVPNIFREDKIVDFDNKKTLLENAKEKEKDLIKV